MPPFLPLLPHLLHAPLCPLAGDTWDDLPACTTLPSRDGFAVTVCLLPFPCTHSLPLTYPCLPHPKVPIYTFILCVLCNPSLVPFPCYTRPWEEGGDMLVPCLLPYICMPALVACAFLTHPSWREEEGGLAVPQPVPFPICYTCLRLPLFSHLGRRDYLPTRAEDPCHLHPTHLFPLLFAFLPPPCCPTQICILPPCLPIFLTAYPLPLFQDIAFGWEDLPDSVCLGDDYLPTPDTYLIPQRPTGCLLLPYPDTALPCLMGGGGGGGVQTCLPALPHHVATTYLPCQQFCLASPPLTPPHHYLPTYLQFYLLPGPGCPCLPAILPARLLPGRMMDGGGLCLWAGRMGPFCATMPREAGPCA